MDLNKSCGSCEHQSACVDTEKVTYYANKLTQYIKKEMHDGKHVETGCKGMSLKAQVHVIAANHCSSFKLHHEHVGIKGELWTVPDSHSSSLD